MSAMQSPAEDRRRGLRSWSSTTTTAWPRSTPPTSTAPPASRSAARPTPPPQALDLVADLRPDLVLMDVYLPDGDGLGVIRKLLEAPESAEPTRTRTSW